jgi:hypothetical protein
MARRPPELPRISAALARHARQCVLATEILISYVAARRAIARAPLDAMLSGWREAGTPGDGVAADPLAEAWRLARAVSRTLRLIPADTRCLTRALVLTRVLARRGIPSKLVISAGTEPEFLAHAWVEHAGKPLLWPGDPPLARLVEL